MGCSQSTAGNESGESDEARTVSHSIEDEEEFGRRLTRSNTTHYIRVHEAAMAEIFRAGSGLCGLHNLGNTCYMNACLQSLAHVTSLSDYFLGYEWHREINAKNSLGFGGRVALAFGELIEAMWTSRNASALSPSAFKRTLSQCSPMFAGRDQHDAHELLTVLLDSLHEDLNRCKAKGKMKEIECDGKDEEKKAAEAWAGYLERDRSIIVDIFQGQLKSTVIGACGHKSVSFDPFMYLSVPLVSSGSSRAPLDVEQCVEDFSTEENLDEKWFCEKCKKRVRASKTIELWKLPPVLIIHLKRFSFDSRGRSNKISTLVDFPLSDLDLTSICKSPQRDLPLYDCFAVINHHGDFGTSGHYTNFAKNRVDGRWRKYNDSRVSDVARLSDIKSKDAYVLFYSRIVDNSSDRSISSASPRTAAPPAVIVRRQSISLPHLWPHYRDEPDQCLANIPLRPSSVSSRGHKGPHKAYRNSQRPHYSGTAKELNAAAGKTTTEKKRRRTSASSDKTVTATFSHPST